MEIATVVVLAFWTLLNVLWTLLNVLWSYGNLRWACDLQRRL